MRSQAKCHTIRRRFRRAFSLVEAAVSVLLVGVTLVAALNTVGASRVAQQNTSERRRAHQLARELMSEILLQDYADPEDTGRIDLSAQSLVAASLGREPGESNIDRRDFDDVDDYHNWIASPPQNRDGTQIPNLTGWKRMVTVSRGSLLNARLVTPNEEGIKSITVEVQRDGGEVARLTAIKGAGLPPPPTGPRVLFFVADPANLTAPEQARQALLESFGSTVTHFRVGDSLAAYETAIADVDVTYIHPDFNSSDIRDVEDYATGVVSERVNITQRLGFATNYVLPISRNTLTIVNSSHYITSSLGTVLPVIFNSAQPVHAVNNNSNFQAPDLQILGTWLLSEPSLLALETGALREDNIPSVGRRVQLPWGGAAMDINELTDDGKTIMKRALEWAASMETP